MSPRSASVVALVLLSYVLGITHATNIYVINNCGYPVWAAADPGSGKRLNPGEKWQKILPFYANILNVSFADQVYQFDFLGVLAKMVQGKLEVVLINAKGLDNTDFLNNMDPYVILSYGSQKRKSKIASGQGTEPEWNEKFTFDVNFGGDRLILKILDSDCGTEDDCVGEATIPLEAVFCEGKVPTTPYNVVKDQEFRGQIKVSLSFIHKTNYREHGMAVGEESYGGWRESSVD